jgi:hypothetical protein
LRASFLDIGLIYADCVYPETPSLVSETQSPQGLRAVNCDLNARLIAMAIRRLAIDFLFAT